MARPWPPPIAQAARPSPGPPASDGSSSRDIRRSNRIVPDAPHGCPSPIAPPSRADPVLVQAQLVDHREHHRRERLGDLDRADVGSGCRDGPAAVQQPPDRGRRAETGQVGPPGGDRRAEDPQVGQVRRAGRSLRWSPPSAAAPSEIPQELPAVAVPSGAEGGPKPGQPRASSRPARGRSSADSCCTATISAVVAARRRRRRTVSACERAAYSVLRGPADAELGRQGVRGLAHVRVRVTGRRERCAGVAHAAPRRPTGGQNRQGAVLADSAPPASTSSASPARTRDAACSTASSPDPHCRSTVTPGTVVAQTGGQRRHPGDVAAGPEAVADDDVVDRQVQRGDLRRPPRRARARSGRSTSTPARACPRCRWRCGARRPAPGRRGRTERVTGAYGSGRSDRRLPAVRGSPASAAATAGRHQVPGDLAAGGAGQPVGQTSQRRGRDWAWSSRAGGVADAVEIRLRAPVRAPP